MNFDQAEIDDPRRWLQTQGINNLRDMGGYTTDCGKRLKWGLLFRSASLYRASDKDQNFLLEKLAIKDVIDLRKRREKDLEPEPKRLMSLVKYHSLAIAIDGTAKDDIDRRLQQTNACEAFEGLLIAANVQMASRHHNDIRQWFTILLENTGPFLFHCTEGKDRTGFTAAILLSALGVSHEQILYDYLLTNTVNQQSIEQRVARSRVLSSFNVAVEDLQRLLAADASYLNAAFNVIQENYGSVGTYLKQAIGLDARALEALKTKFLE